MRALIVREPHITHILQHRGLLVPRAEPQKVISLGQAGQREGSLIMWVRKGRRYLGQVRDGVFYDLRKK